MFIVYIRKKSVPMKSLIVNPPEKGVEIKDVEMVKMTNQVLKIRILENGICGTDREIVNGLMATAKPPVNENYMVLGHEAVGQALEDGVLFHMGDLVMPVNRRGCNKCLNCLTGRPDFCETGEFVEAGISGLHGFMREFLYEKEENLILVPKGIEDIAILGQPLSDLEKSLSEILTVQRRMIWTCQDGTYRCRKALVIGSGTIGILTSMLLRSNGFQVDVVNRRDATDKEFRIFEGIGANYINVGDDLEVLKAGNLLFDLIFDASGSDADLLSKSIRLTKNNGIIGLFGFPSKGIASITHQDLQKVVFKSLIVVGLINGQKPHFERAMQRLAEWKSVWPDVVKELITGTIPVSDSNSVISALQRKKEGEIKVKITWA